MSENGFCLCCGVTEWRDRELCKFCWMYTPSIALSKLSGKPGEEELEQANRRLELAAKAMLRLRRSPPTDPTQLAHLIRVRDGGRVKEAA